MLPRERGLTEPPISQPVADTEMLTGEPSSEPSPVSELATTPATAEPLSNDTQAYLVDIARDPFLEATQRDRRLGHSGWKGNRVRAELVDRGLVRLVRVNTYRRGGAFTACEVTQQGRGLLQEIKVPYRVRGKGGFVHRYWQHIIQAWLHGQGHHAEIEARSPGGEKQVDVGATVDGSRVAFEVVVVGLDKEQSNLTKDREDGWDRVVFCCDRTSTIRSLQRRLGGAPGLEFRLCRRSPSCRLGNHRYARELTGATTARSRRGPNPGGPRFGRLLTGGLLVRVQPEDRQRPPLGATVRYCPKSLT